MVFDKIWVRVSCKTRGTHTDLSYVVALQQLLNEINKTKRLSFSLHNLFSSPTIPYTVGEQLRWEVQRWLSPPDPSTNQNIVRRARLKGTAAWFLESSALAEWKSRASLLWIHGKRTLFEPPMNILP
jgi:hypothetical protein